MSKGSRTCERKCVYCLFYWMFWLSAGEPCFHTAFMLSQGANLTVFFYFLPKQVVPIIDFVDQLLIYCRHYYSFIPLKSQWQVFAYIF